MNWTPQRIKQLRKRLKMSQTQLAEAIGVSLRTCQYWEADENPTTPTRLAQKALDRLKEGR